MRILIADDEHLARVTLRSMIEDIFPNFEICEVTNGEELINQAIIFRPHLAFVDINMPRFTGLEAISELKELLPLTQWLILTGYAEFDYAKKALSMGVCDYLVKPLRPTKLKESLKKAINQYNNQINRRNALFEQKVRDALHGRNVDYIIDKAFLLLIHIEKLDEREMGLLKIKIKEDLLIFYDNKYDYALLKISQRDLLLVIKSKKDKIDDLNVNDIYNLLNKKDNYLFWMFNLKLMKQNTIFLDSVNKLIDYSSNWICKNSFSISKVDDYSINIPIEIEENYRVITKTNSQIEKKNKLKEIISILNEFREKDLLLANVIFSNLMCLLSDNNYYIVDDNKEYNYSQLLNTLPSLSPQISDVINYIDEHFSEDIGIKQISYLIGISPNYLSAKFKSEMNMRFIDYLTNKRIEKACFLIKNSNLFIHNIANEVGFKDVKHFSKIFKKYKNCLPSEY
ncbi:MAG: response regulator transcription factor [Pleomorphochaeta sp.]